MAHSLIGWTPLTCRLLKEGGSTAWNVIDGALGEEVCEGIQKELIESNALDKLLPARTKGEAQAAPLLTLFTLQDDPSAMVRGDKSLYISREYRSNPRFSERHPNLHHLIETVQTTLVNEMSSTIDIDTTQTSVQLAVYPGDGISGYVRHCDRGNEFCRHEAGSASQVGRILTAIYYLTDSDWNADNDGGHLRLFHVDSQTTDLTPYRDRLVIFRADCVEHQVLPSKRRPRTAITMWFYGSLILSTSTILPHSDSKNIYHSNEMRDDHNPSTANRPRKYPALHQEGPPALPTAPPNDQSKSIFVAISSYRDSETSSTLQSLFSQAQNPQRIYVGLMLQLDDKLDGNIWTQIENLVNDYPNQIRCLRMTAKDASGPCYARALCQSLHRGEDFFLQIDSHMRFRNNWDSYLIQIQQDMVAARKDDRVILTTYPIGYTLPNTIPNETRGTLLVPWKFDDNGMLRQRSRLLQPRCDPVPCHLIAAGFLFGPKRMIHEVPYDPNLHQLFFGEELSIAVRLFTHGYDCYAPPETVCYHLWSRAHRPTQRAATPSEMMQREASIKIVRQQLLGVDQRTPYGLGSRRSALDFARALRVDFETHKFLDKAFENGNLSSEDFVPDQSHAIHPAESLEHRVASLDFDIRLRLAQLLA